MRRALVLGLWAVLACEDSGDGEESATTAPSTGSAEEAGTGEDGRGTDETGGCPGDLPPPSDPCVPECGNELGVGQPCTRGGGECNANPGAVFCTGDFNAETTLVYCTQPCVEDVDCGADAVCVGDPADPSGPRGCIPTACQ